MLEQDLGFLLVCKAALNISSGSYERLARWSRGDKTPRTPKSLGTPRLIEQKHQLRKEVAVPANAFSYVVFR
jgi:hypothetical protein